MMKNVVPGTLTESRNQYGERVVSWAFTDPTGRVVWVEQVDRHDHACVGGRPGSNGYWEFDNQGIELCKVCDLCRSEKLRRFRPEILTGYSQADVDEPIEPSDW